MCRYADHTWKSVVESVHLSKKKQIIYYNILSFFIAYSFGQILFLLRLFFPALLINPILPLRFQADAKTPCPVTAGHVDVLFVQHDGKGFG